MKLTQQSESTNRTAEGMSHFVPLGEIQRRVARIKRGWNDDTARARAVEGQRRRGELECLLGDLLAEADWSDEMKSELGTAEQAEEAGFTIAG